MMDRLTHIELLLRGRLVAHKMGLFTAVNTRMMVVWVGAVGFIDTMMVLLMVLITIRMMKIFQMILMQSDDGDRHFREDEV